MTPNELRKRFTQWAGIDSMNVCDQEGYMQGCWKGRWSQKTPVTLFMTSGVAKDVVEKQGTYTAHEVYREYLKKKEKIDRFIGTEWKGPATDIYQLLQMATDVEQVTGLL